MKKVLLWSFSADDWPVCRKILNGFFADGEVEVTLGSFLTPRPKDFSCFDLAIVTFGQWYEFVKKQLPQGTPIVAMKYTIMRKEYERIAAITKDECVSVVSDTIFFTECSISMLAGMGIRRERMKPWYPTKGEDELCRMILLFEQAGLAETSDHEYIHFCGQGVFSIESLVQIAGILGMWELLETEFFRRYRENVMPAAHQLLDTESGYVWQMRRPVNGLMYFTAHNRISYYGRNVAELLGVKPGELTDRNLFDVFPFLKCWDKRWEEYEEHVVKYNGRDLAFDIWTSVSHGVMMGYILISDYQREKEKELVLRTRLLRKHYQAKYTLEDIIGESVSIDECRKTALKFAGSRSNVLITGPSGTGKELFASAIHNASERCNGPFVAVNCGALMESLLESELFGYESGAFTGAQKGGKEGLFEAAHEGTLFLDEIGEMPLRLQVKLLRVLQEREVVRVGGKKAIPVDVRIIAATNRDLKKEVNEGKFRLDLYYRLNVLPLDVPGLNERREDILPLFQYFEKEEGFTFDLDERARACILEHDYVGNVRELRNCVEYLSCFGSSRIGYEDLPLYMRREAKINLTPVSAAGLPGRSESGDSSAQLKETEKPEKKDSHEEGKGAEQILNVSLELSQKELVFAAARILCKKNGQTGRRGIHQYLVEQGYGVSEMQVRKELEILRKEERILIGKGRFGVRIAE